MKEDILSRAVKIARVIDDGIERDAALSNIAQVQAAANCPEDALETIANIRYVDIRADALRKSLDNLQTRFCLKKETMPQIDVWLEKLMEETMSIPDINVRCPTLHAINLLILSRMDNNEIVDACLEQTRCEFFRLNNDLKRFRYLFALYQLYMQMGEDLKASKTLLYTQKISEQEPVSLQGQMKGMVAYEFWKLKGRSFTFRYMNTIHNRKIQLLANLQLVALLALGGNVEEAKLFAQHLTDENHKNFSKRFIEIGKTLIHSVLEMKGAILNLTKSFCFRDDLFNNNSDGSHQEMHFPFPVWYSLSVSIVPKNDNNDSAIFDSCINEDDLEDEPESYNHEINWDEYDWDGYDWDNVREKNKEFDKLFCNHDSDDEDESWEESSYDDEDESWEESIDDEEDESWEESIDDDEGEPWKESIDDDEDEPWKESSDDDEDEPWKESSDDNAAGINMEDILKAFEMYGKIQKAFLNNFAFKGLPKILRKKILERMDYRDGTCLNNIARNKLFSMTEAIQGVVSFNRTLPPSLFQHFIRRLNTFFSIIEKDNYQLSPQKKGRIKEFIARQKEIGFDEAFQEVVSQGDYLFAVECSLKYYCSMNQENLVFGYDKIL